RGELLGALRSLSQGESAANLIEATAKPTKLAYLFSGQGSQRPGMGKELYRSHPAYAAAYDEVCEALDRELGLSLKEIVFSEEEEAAKRLDHTSLAQPAIFATEVALARALASQGLEPDLLVGHSIGEIAAAHVSGVLSLQDAAKLIGSRATLMGALPAGGAMLAVSASEQEAEAAIEGREAEIAIAAVNSPSSVVLSGEEEAIEVARAHFQERGKRTKRLSVSHAFHSPLMEPMLQEFAQVAKSLTYDEPKVPIVSNLSGEILTPSQATDPAYWVAQVREPVRFATATETLAELGALTFIEIGPEPVLTAMASETLEGKEAALIPTLRSGHSEPEALAKAIASAHASGAKLDWEAFFKGTGAKRVPLPTYPFQRERYWIAPTGGADLSAAGQAAAEHPLLGAVVEIAGEEGGNLLLTGRLSLATHPWLADHQVMDTALLPGTAFLELALHAAERTGAEGVAELALQAPLVLPESGAVQIQVSVEAADEEDQRQIAIHSRPEGGEEELSPEWTCHATGVLGETPPIPPEPLTEWPPPGAESIELDSFYGDLADLGLDLGPAFQGLTRAWREGEEILAEVSLADGQREEAERFAIHPALLELAQVTGSLRDESEELLPSAWREVGLLATGATELRVRLRTEEGQTGLDLFDAEGAPLARIGSLARRGLSSAALKGARSRQEVLLGIEWTEVELAALEPSSNGSTPALATIGELQVEDAERFASLDALVEALASGQRPPQTVLVQVEAKAAKQQAKAAQALAQSTLELLQAWLGCESLSGSRLALLTTGAVPVADGEAPALSVAPVWGLVRSAQSEHPGRFALVDSDGTEESLKALASALIQVGEPQLALRGGQALAPRLVRAPSPSPGEDAVGIDPDRTVLITGATGGLGRLVARRLVIEHGARRLLLISRSGSEAEGAKELREELEALGAGVRVEACDASERKCLEAVLDSIDEAHPLGAVIHAAGVLDDATIEALGKEQIEHVFAPKAIAAWHLHELTRSLDLSVFLVFSSAAGTLGGPGQGNYAAANVFLDALAQKRQAEGLPATSIAWGLWAEQGGMGGGLGEADLA
ncbi:MAG TPA: SDR family NAD(P)-dependent oxidoreductase, partial [Solirubrobacterales bacterium]